MTSQSGWMPERGLQVSDEKLSAIFYGSPDGFVIIDGASGQILDVNPAACRLLGYKAGALTGGHILVLFPPDSHQSIDSLLQRLRVHETVFEIRAFQRADDSVCAMELTATLIPWGKGQAILATLRDVSQGEWKLEALRESEERYRQIFSQSSEGIILVAPETGTIVDFNDRACEMLGYSRREFEGLSLRDIEAQEASQKLRAHLEAILGGGSDTFETLHRRKDRVLLNIEVNATVLEHRGEQVVLGFLRDVTQRKRVEETSQRRNRELALLNRVIAAATSTLDVERVLQIVCQELARAFDLPQAAAALLNAAGTEVTVVAEYLAPGRLSGLGKTIPVTGNPATEYVLEHQAPLAVTDAQRDGRLASVHGLMRERGTASLLIVPIIVAHGRVVGTLGLDAIERHEFSEEEIALAQNVAAAAGQALETARLHQAMQRHSERLEALREIDQAILATQSPEAIAQAAMRHIRRLVPCQRVSVVMFDFETAQGTVLATHVDGETSVGSETRMPLAAFDISEQLREGKTHVVEDTLTLANPALVVQKLQAEGMRSYVSVPLMIQNQLIGSLYLGAKSPRAFALETMEIAREVAAQLAVVIEQAQLRAQVWRQTEKLEALVRERTAELQVALERARSADRVKSEFVSNVSHELRTPLTNLKLYLSLLTRSQPENRKAYLDTLHREVERLQDLIEGLLDLSRIDLGKVQASFQPIDLNLLVGTLVADREALVAERGLIMGVQPAEEMPWTLADPKLIEQVLTNLLTNAVNYTPAGGAITLRTEMAETGGRRWVTVSVADTGPGISKEEQTHLFERFYRGEAGHASDIPGTGLGLAICKEIIDRHDGRITVESQVGHGTIFTAWLPVASFEEEEMEV